MSQFTTSPEPLRYPLELTLEEFKLYKRLRSLDKPCEVHLYCDGQGRATALRVFESKKEESLWSPI